MAGEHEPEGVKAAFVRLGEDLTELSHSVPNIGAEAARWAGLPPRLGKSAILFSVALAALVPVVGLAFLALFTLLIWLIGKARRG